MVRDTAHNAVGGVLFALSSLIFNLSQHFLMCTFPHREEAVYSSNQGISILELREPQAPRYLVLVPVSKTSSKTTLKKTLQKTKKTPQKSKKPHKPPKTPNHQKNPISLNIIYIHTAFSFPLKILATRAKEFRQWEVNNWLHTKSLTSVKRGLTLMCLLYQFISV